MEAQPKYPDETYLQFLNGHHTYFLTNGTLGFPFGNLRHVSSAQKEAYLCIKIHFPIRHIHNDIKKSRKHSI